MTGRGQVDHRADRSVVATATRRDGVWHPGAVVLRHTEHRRSRTATGWTIDEASRAPDHGDREEPVLAALGAAVDAAEATGWPPDVAVQVSVTAWWRDLRPWGSARQVREDRLWAVAVSNPAGSSVRFLCRDAAGVGPLCREVLEAWELLLGTTGPDPGSGRARRRPLLLEPAVAGVLLHELVGHAVEEGDAAEGTRVLPPGVDVRAEPLRATVVDDAGVPTSSVPLVVDGRVSAPPRGHAWVGAHGPRPRTRLPLLRVSAGRPGVEPPADVLRCRAVRGARYFRGLALLDLARVERPGGTHRPAAARAVVRAADLVAATLLAGGPESPGRYGLCVKDGDGLPSRVDCPALLLPAVELVPGPS